MGKPAANGGKHPVDFWFGFHPIPNWCCRIFRNRKHSRGTWWRTMKDFWVIFGSPIFRQPHILIYSHACSIDGLGKPISTIWVPMGTINSWGVPLNVPSNFWRQKNLGWWVHLLQLPCGLLNHGTGKSRKKNNKFLMKVNIHVLIYGTSQPHLRSVTQGVGDSALWECLVILGANHPAFFICWVNLNFPFDLWRPKTCWWTF